MDPFPYLRREKSLGLRVCSGWHSSCFDRDKPNTVHFGEVREQIPPYPPFAKGGWGDLAVRNEAFPA